VISTRIPVRGAIGLVVAVLLVAATTGCDAVGPTAATVDGHDIRANDVMELMSDRAALPGDQTGLKGSGRGTYTTRAFADTLDRLIYFDVLKRELARRHLKVSSAVRAKARATLASTAGVDATKLGKKLRDFVIEFDSVEQVLQAQLGKGETTQQQQARTRYDQILATTPDQLTQLCVTGAVFGSAADAATAKVRAVSGASLAAATQGLQVSQLVDQEQCGSTQQLPAEVASAKVGTYVGPIQAQQGAVLLHLDRKRIQPFDEVKDQLIQSIPAAGSAKLQARVTRLVSKADVHVDPRYGRWNHRAGRVDPPIGAAPAPTTTAPTQGAPTG
jgi:hypothetical protein